MEKKVLIFITFCFVLVFAACKSDHATDEILDAAEQLMMEHPDSALRLIEKINASEISSASTRARHALLYSQAKDKNYIDETNDSLINIAVEHYADGNNTYYKFLSLYYHGRVMFNAGNYNNSILSFTQAEQLVDDIKDPHAIVLLYGQLGLIFSDYNDLLKSLDAYENAYKYFRDAQSTAHQYRALCDIGQLLHNMKNYSRAELTILDVIDWAKQNDERLYHKCLEQLFYIYEASNDYERMAEVNKLITAESSASLNIIGSAYQLALGGETSEAKQKIEQAWQSTANRDDTVDVLYAAYRVERMLGNHKEALGNYEKMMAFEDSVLRQTLEQPVATTQRDYYQSEAELNAYKLKINRYTTFAIVIIALLIIAIILLYIRHKILIKQAEINGYIANVCNLQSELKDKELEISDKDKQLSIKSAEIDAFSAQLKGLFNKQFALLDQLTGTYYESCSTKREKEAIYKAVKHEIDKFGKNGKIFTELEAIVNNHKENVMQLLRKGVELSENDYRLMCLIYAGFSTRAICVFTNCSQTTIYSRKSRIKSEIAIQQSPGQEIIDRYML